MTVSAVQVLVPSLIMELDDFPAFLSTNSCFLERLSSLFISIRSFALSLLIANFIQHSVSEFKKKNNLTVIQYRFTVAGPLAEFSLRIHVHITKQQRNPIKHKHMPCNAAFRNAASLLLAVWRDASGGTAAEASQHLPDPWLPFPRMVAPTA